MKKIITIFLCFSFIFLNIYSSVYSLSFDTNINFDVNSQSVYMVNADSDMVVYSKNADEKLEPASLVKIMTAIIVLENVSDIDVLITAPSYIYDEFVNMSVSTADIRRGEIISIRDLLYSLMLQSACEAASILADHVSNQDIPKFIDMMNQKAKEIGASNTNFTNAHGLPDSNQYTTSKDMYLITKYALSIPLFEEISTTVRYEMQATNIHTSSRYVVHTNLMLDKSRGGKYYYQYAKGIKTGTSVDSRNLVSMASKDGYNYILIVLGAPIYDKNYKLHSDNYSLTDSINFYNWAFNTYKLKTIVSKDTSIAEAKIKLSNSRSHVLLSPEKDFIYLLPDNIDVSSVQKVINIPEFIKAPVKKGDVVGTVDFKLKDESLGVINLVSEEDIDNDLFLTIIDTIGTIVSSIWFKITIAVLILLVLLYFVLIIVYRNKKNNKKPRK